MVDKILSHKNSQRKYYHNNKDKILAYVKKYRSENREYLREKWKGYAKKRRALHKESIKEYEKSPNRALKNSERQKVRRYKVEIIKNELGGKCVQCGFNDIRVLHFHHLRDKEFEIGSNIRLPIEKLREEAKKCILLCANCHFLHHVNNRKQK